MQPLDSYRLQLSQLVASIKAWSGFVADVAKVEMQEIGEGWRLAMLPTAPGACPLEVVLDGREPKCDLKVGREIYEDWPLPSLDIVLPLVEAVAEGRIVTRQMVSAATGLPLAVSTQIALANGTRIELPSGRPDISGPASLARSIHYVPYRKPT